VKRVVLAIMTSLALCGQSAGTIEGRVTNSITGESVGGVTVRFLDRKSRVFTTATDSTGSYRLTGLNDGDYHGEFTKDGFSENSGNPFFHVAGGAPVPVNAQMKPWGSLRGRVVDEDLKPAAKVRMEIGPRPAGVIDDDTFTDQNGEFAFPNLAPGSYTLVAKPETKIRMQDGVRVGTVAMYYPSVTELAQAVRIPVRLGENVLGIEIRLKSVPVHRVAGVVLSEAGKPVAHATVKLMGRAGTTRQALSAGMITSAQIAGAGGAIRLTSPPGFYTIVGPGPEPEVAGGETGNDGTFEFAAVQEGDWRLSAEAGVYEDMPLSGVASALISEKDVEDVQIRLTGPFAVEFTMDFGSAQAAASAKGAPIMLGLTALGLTAVEGQPRAIVNDPAKNMGRINSVFPGRYRVIPGTITGDFYVGSVMWGGRDVNGQVVDLTPGAAPFQMIFKPGLGKVRGRVEKGEGSMVFLISRGSGEILNYRQAACGTDGTFEIGQVPPGDYYVVAFDRTERGGLPAADLPAAIVPIASNVRVEAGSTESVDVRLNRWPW
jgi:hypothetical protein